MAGSQGKVRFGRRGRGERLIEAGTRQAFERMAIAGTGDAGALAIGLRKGVTSLGMRALAAKALHAAAAAPERMVDIYDNAAAGWLAGPVFPPRTRFDEALPISRGFWKAFWDLVGLPPVTRQEVFAGRTLGLAGLLDPRINVRMAAAALDRPGVAEATAGEIPDPFDLESLAACPPASLGYALHQEAIRAAGLAEPFGPNVVALLRHMPPPLAYINIQVIQSLPLLRLVAGYGPSRLDQVAFGGFLMGQNAHHYSALSTAVTLTVAAAERPAILELILDCVFKGWVHGRNTPQLIGVTWDDHWLQSVDKVRGALGVTPFESPETAAIRQLSRAPRD